MSTLVPGSGSFQVSGLAGLGYELGFWVVFTIIISLTLTLTLLITTLTLRGPFKCYVTQMGWGLSDFLEKSVTKV